ncbi:hypothetical protein [Gloeocapsopsis sp. IPPAS B-1203]|nr:hypothetical protein [Gloeocapsopsis sp. IPPAS B-1203]
MLDRDVLDVLRVQNVQRVRDGEYRHSVSGVRDDRYARCDAIAFSAV